MPAQRGISRGITRGPHAEPLRRSEPIKQAEPLKRSEPIKRAGPVKRGKDEVYWTILNAAIGLDFRKGHQQWTFSELARTSGVTRSLFYYYFGKSRFAILGAAVHLLGEEFFGLTPLKYEAWRQGRITETVLSTRRSMEKSPHLGAFYLAHRFRPTEIGESIRQLETKYLKKIGQFFPSLNPDQVRGVSGLLFGLVFAPELTDASVEEAVRIGIRVGGAKRLKHSSTGGY
jgi:AcrR family transcriptional regulator